MTPTRDQIEHTVFSVAEAFLKGVFPFVRDEDSLLRDAELWDAELSQTFFVQTINDAVGVPSEEYVVLDFDGSETFGEVIDAIERRYLSGEFTEWFDVLTPLGRA